MTCYVMIVSFDVSECKDVFKARSLCGGYGGQSVGADVGQDAHLRSHLGACDDFPRVQSRCGRRLLEGSQDVFLFCFSLLTDFTFTFR